MASRRMFAKSITQSSSFLRMPMTSRLLYYDLGMQADDDGFCEWYTVIQMTGATQQDLEVLQANGFVRVFDQDVLVIRDWKENNYIQKDRYNPSKYLSKYQAQIESSIDVSDSNVSIADTQVRLGKDRLVKVSNVYVSPKITKYSSLEDITEEVLGEISAQYSVPLGFVKLQFEKLTNYCASNGRRYKNYKAALRNFVLSDMQKVVTTPRKGGVVDGTNL